MFTPRNTLTSLKQMHIQKYYKNTRIDTPAISTSKEYCMETNHGKNVQVTKNSLQIRKRYFKNISGRNISYLSYVVFIIF